MWPEGNVAGEGLQTRSGRRRARAAGDGGGPVCYGDAMSAALKPMTMDEFLAWEECQEERFEFDGFRPVAMTGGTFAHEMIGATLRRELGNRLPDRCVVLGPTMKIEVAGRIRYPDAFVLCSAAERKTTVIHEPVVVFEVLSESTSKTDHLDKFNEYEATPSIQRYVILEQDSIAAMVFTHDGSRSVVETITAGGILRLPEIGVELPIDLLYSGVEPDAA